MKKRKFKILIDGAGTATAISVIKGLRKQDKYEIEIICIDMDEFNAGRFFADKFYKVPPATFQDFLSSVLSICQQENIDIFIPIIDLSFQKLSENKDKFEQLGTFLLIPEPEVVDITDDKFKTYIFFKENKLPTPRVFTNIKEINKFPVFIKPRKGGRASINTFKIQDRDELEFYIRKYNNMIIQEFVEGEEFTADCLNSLDGEFIECVIRKRIETKGGVSIKSEIIKGEVSKRIKEHIIKITERLKIPGSYNIQGFITDNNSILFTEINPRFAGTHSFTIEAGLNSVKYILDMYCGAKTHEIKQKININTNLKMVRYWDEVFIDDGKVYNPWRLLK